MREPSAELVAEARAAGFTIYECTNTHAADAVEEEEMIQFITGNIARFAHEHAQRETARLREACEAALRILDAASGEGAFRDSLVAAETLRAALGPPDGASK